MRYSIWAHARAAGLSQLRQCGRRSPVEVRYELRGKSGPDGEQLSGMWRWQRWLPVAAEQIVSLGEGATPLRPLATPGSGSLYLKNETADPTWSWKDRSISVSVSMARAFGFTRIAAVSTGNHGVAASAYAASAGCECVIFCHEDAAPLQMALMRYYGARIVRGGRRGRMLTRLVETGNWFPASVYCP